MVWGEWEEVCSASLSWMLDDHCRAYLTWMSSVMTMWLQSAQVLAYNLGHY